jgi:N-acetylglucosamine kinase-like BadF-type ATPase
LVFEPAADADAVAVAILEQAGREVARAVAVVCERLFAADAPVTVVFGGSVFMRGVSPVMIDTIRAEVTLKRPTTSFVRLQVEPVLGAVGFALDDAGLPAGGAIWNALCESFADAAPQE